MKINDMNNLWTAYNKTEDFAVFVVALDKEEAMEYARDYGSDSNLADDWEIREFSLTDKSDCDYIITNGQ